MQQTATQLRMPETVYKEISRISAETGLSKNSTILMLIRLGKKLYDAEIQVTASGHPVA